MNRAVRLTGYFIICLFTWLPLQVSAQSKPLTVLKHELDSINAGPPPVMVTTEDTTTAAAGDEDYTDTDEDTTVTAAEKPAKQHYLWDQDVPVSSDSLSEYNYDGYEGGSLVVRKIPAKLLKELNADKKLQYDRKEKEKEDQEAKARSNYRFLRIFFEWLFRLLHVYRWAFVIIIACALVILLFMLLKGNGFSFSFRKPVKEEAVVLSDEELDLDTYEKQIRESIANKQLRVAVRLLYLQTLRLLADKEVISFSKGKTNATYLRAMAQTKWYKAFANLTLDYEYIWYGEVPVNETQFNVIQSHFSQFMNELGYTR
jgi:hypothetical protein